MIENLISTILFTLLVFYAIGLALDLYEARKNKNKIESFFLFIAFACCIVLYYKLPYIFLVYL